jgi:hypothetical protein
VKCLGNESCKTCLEKLTQLDTRDQAASYRTIVSYESEALKDFSFCVFQKHNVFQCEATIPTIPQVNPISEWRGENLTEEMARSLLIGHLDDEKAPKVSQELDAVYEGIASLRRFVLAQSGLFSSHIFWLIRVLRTWMSPGRWHVGQMLHSKSVGGEKYYPGIFPRLKEWPLFFCFFNSDQFPSQNQVGDEKRSNPCEFFPPLSSFLIQNWVFCFCSSFTKPQKVEICGMIRYFE